MTDRRAEALREAHFSYENDLQIIFIAERQVKTCRQFQSIGVLTHSHLRAREKLMHDHTPYTQQYRKRECSKKAEALVSPLTKVTMEQNIERAATT